MTAIYNECLKAGCFPTNWRTAIILPITKPDIEDSVDPTKYRPINLINTVGKVLENLLIKRIMHHLYKIEFLNDNQYRFTPQKNTIYAAMEPRKFIVSYLEKGRVVIVVSLDVKGALDSAWWPAILKELRETNCPPQIFTILHRIT